MLGHDGQEPDVEHPFETPRANVGYRLDKEWSSMSESVNKASLLGRLTRDPESRQTNSGESMVTFGMATTESWRDRESGGRKERTEYHNIVVFNENIAKTVEAYCRKGSQVYIEGQLQTREFTDRDGNQRKATEIVLQRFRGELTLLGKPDSTSTANAGASAADTERRPLFDEQPAAPKKAQPLFPSAGNGKDGGSDPDIPF